MVGGAWGEKASDRTLQGASDRIHTRVRHHLGGWVPCFACVPEASVDLCRLVLDSRSVTHHEAPMTCEIDAVEARPVRVQLGGGH